MQTPLHKFAGRRIAVIGDVMLDSYLAGDVARISPEAPVPVVRVNSERMVPGGAANVAANLASLKVQVSLVGLTGRDSARDMLESALQAFETVDSSGMIAVADRCTTRKLRIIGAHQQITRVDFENREKFTLAMEADLIKAMERAVATAEIVVISDYGKGVCSDRLLQATMRAASSRNIRVVVDPKRTDFASYAGASVLTPNRKELYDATRMPCETDADALAAARQAQRECTADIILTRSEKGMSLFPLDAEPTHLGTVAQDIFDVSGAGDTVVAVLAAGMAAGFPLADCMRIANHAAGIVVSKLGTATVSQEELGLALLENDVGSDPETGQLLTLAEATVLRASWGRQKLTVGFTNGCFDLLHPGHIALIRQAAAACDRLIVAINSDASVRRLKGDTRPIQDARSRAEVMGAIKGVGAVIIFDEDTPAEPVRHLQPDVLIKGADYTVDQIAGADIVLSKGGRVVLAQLEDGHSTTALVSNIAGR